MTLALTTSEEYSLPPSLQDLHQKTVEWESSIELWKRELAFFNKLMKRYGSKLNYRENVKEREHLKLLLAYYAGDLMTALTEEIGRHESHLMPLVQGSGKQDEVSYRMEHRSLEKQFDAFENEFQCYKQELYSLIEKVMVRENQNALV